MSELSENQEIEQEQEEQQSENDVTQDEIEYQKNSFDLGGFFGGIFDALPGTLSGIGAIRASRNPNLTTYAPSITGDSTYINQSGRRLGYDRQNDPLGTGDNKTTIIIAVVVGVLVLVTLFLVLRKR